MPVFAIVLLLHVNKTFAQTSQPPAGLNLHSSGTAMAEPQNTKTTTTAQAVNPQRETEVATRMSKTLESQLSLTTDQYLKVYEATLNYVKEMDAHKSGTPLTKEAHDQYVAEKKIQRSKMYLPRRSTITT